MRWTSAAALLSLTAFAFPALAITNPFTETFDSSSANWSSAAAFTAMTHLPAGGVGGSGFARSTASLAGAAVGSQPLLIRAQSNFNSSGNELFGNWLAAGVQTLSLSLRHDAPAAVSFFVRFAPEAGPGAVAIVPVPIQPNAWTPVSIAINPATPFIFEGTTFQGSFSSVFRVQVGVIVDAPLSGTSTPINFDVDNVGVVPAPGALGLLGIGGLLAARRRR